MKIHYPYGTKFRGLLLFFFHFTYALDFLYFHQNSAKKGWFVVPVPMLHIHTFPGVFWYQQYLASLENCLYIFFSLHLLLNSAFFFFLELIFSDKFPFLLFLLLKHIYQFLCFFLTCHPRLFYFTIIQTSLLTRPIHLHL